MDKVPFQIKAVKLVFCTIASMSVCSPCTPIKILPDCVDAIVIGTMPAINNPYFIYIKDITTGRTERYSETSDGAALLTIPITKMFSPAHAYEIWVTTNFGSIEDKIAIQIQGVTGTVDCAALKFESSYSAGVKNTFAKVTMEGI